MNLKNVIAKSFRIVIVEIYQPLFHGKMKVISPPIKVFFKIFDRVIIQKNMKLTKLETISTKAPKKQKLILLACHFLYTIANTINLSIYLSIYLSFYLSIYLVIYSYSYVLVSSGPSKILSPKYKW